MSSLNDYLLHNHVLGPSPLDLLDTQVGHNADAGQVGHEVHEDSHLVVDLLVHVEVYLRRVLLTSS